MSTVNAQPPRSEVAAFAADPSSSAQARKFVRHALDKVGVNPHVTDIAVLVASELVTNAVLHAHAGPILTVHVEDETVRLEVEDNSELFPLLRNYGHEAVTGRGMSVVEATASRWGVETTQNGKTIWVEFSCDETKLGENAPEPMTRQKTENISAAVKSASPAGMFPLLFRDVVVDTYLQLEQHHEALLREFELISIGSLEDPHSANASLIELIAAVRPILAEGLSNFREQIAAARTDNCATSNLTGGTNNDAIAWSRQFTELMKEADALCDSGQLLTAPPAREVRALRAWFIEEMTRQYVDRLPPRSMPDLSQYR